MPTAIPCEILTLLAIIANRAWPISTSKFDFGQSGGIPVRVSAPPDDNAFGDAHKTE
ncbi:MAG: hypothetical protein WBE37_33240 [Bryobacteraceae bacterium]